MAFLSVSVRIRPGRCPGCCPCTRTTPGAGGADGLLVDLDADLGEHAAAVELEAEVA